MPAPTLDELIAAKPRAKGSPPTLGELQGATPDPNEPHFLQRALDFGRREAAMAFNDYAASAIRFPAGLDHKTANAFMILDRGAKWLSIQTKGTLTYGGAFAKLERLYRDESIRLEQAAQKREAKGAGGLPGKINRIFGSLPGMVTEAGAAILTGGGARAGLAGLGVLTQADKGWLASIRAGVEGGTIGQIFKVTAPLTAAGRAGALGSGTGAISAGHGAPGEDVALDAATMGVLGALGARPKPRPQQPMTTAEFRLHMRTEKAAGRPRIDFEPKVKTGKAEVEAEPLGLARDPVLEPKLAQMGKEEFEAHRVSAVREVDRLERKYDEQPGRADTDPAFRGELIKAQDKFDAATHEQYRRQAMEWHPEEIAFQLRTLGSSKEAKLNAMILVDVVSKRGLTAELRSNLEEFARRSPDHAEILKSKLEDWRKFTATPKAKPAVQPQIEAGLVKPPLIEVTSRTAEAADTFLGKDYSELQPPTRQVRINLDRLKGSEDFKQVVGELDEFFRSEIDYQRRGTITHQQLQRLADDLNMTVEDLISTRRGQAFKPEEILRARMLNRTALGEWSGLGRKIRGGKATDLEKANFLRATALVEDTMAHTLGGAAEAGRALEAHKQRVGPSTVQLKNIRHLINEFRSGKGKVSVEDFADMVAGIETPEGLARFSREAAKATTGDKFMAAWINGLLTSPRTHSTNIMSNTYFALWSIPEEFTAASIGGVLSGASRAVGRGPIERVYFREVMARAHGMAEGAMDGARLAAHVMHKGASVAPAGTKIELLRPEPFESKLGRLVFSTGRVLVAEDAFFRMIGYRMELKAQAVRQAIKEGRKGTDYTSRVVELESNPPPNMVEAAIENGRRLTFTKELTGFGRSVQKATNQHRWAKVLAPFVRTPLNIFKEGIRRSPLAPLMGEVRGNLGAGGARAQQETAIIALNNGVLMYLATKVASGLITGSGPEDPELRRAWLATGRKPFSWRIGNTYRSYSRIEPAATPLGIMADFVDITGHLDEKTADEVGAAIWWSFRKNITNKSFIQSISAVGEAFASPRGVSKFTETLARSIVPTVVGDINRQFFDPVLRDVRGAVDAIMSRIPGFSKTLRPQRNIWGEPILLDGGWGPDLISPFYQNTLVPDFATQEAWRVRAQFARPDRKIGDLELEQDEYDQFDRETGQKAKMAIDKFVVTPHYLAIPDVLKREIMQREYAMSRQLARLRLITKIQQEDPERGKKALLGGTLAGELTKLRDLQ